MRVTLINHMGSDATIVNAARVSFNRDDPTQQSPTLTAGDRGLIGFLMRNKHASPFEHCVLSFAIETTIAVSREAMRHRTFSFNEFSTRYSEIPRGADTTWYVPDKDHIRTQTGKPGSYTYAPITDAGTIDHVQASIEYTYKCAANVYAQLVDSGVAREVARNVLPLGSTTSFWMTGNLRNWFNFLVLRTAPAALLEIREIAIEIETRIASLHPAAHAAWVECGRPQI